MAAQAAFSAVTLGVAILAPALQTQYGLSLGATGIVIASPAIGSLTTLLLWGLLADRVGERIVTAAGLGMAGASLAAAAYAPNATALVVLLALAGAAGSSVNAATGRAVMAWFARAERGFALGVRQTAVPLGGGLAALALPLFLREGSARVALLVLACGCAAAALGSAAVLRRAPERWHQSQELVHPLRDRRIWSLAAGSALLSCAQVNLVRFTVLYLYTFEGLSTTAAAVVLAGTQVFGAAGRIGAGRWSDRRADRIGPLRRVTLALAVAAGLVAVLANGPRSAVVPALVVAGGLAMSWNGLSFTATAELAGHARAGVALGFQQTALAVAGATTPMAFAAIVSFSSWQAAFAVVAICPLAALFFFKSVSDSPSSQQPGPLSAVNG